MFKARHEMIALGALLVVAVVALVIFELAHYGRYISERANDRSVLLSLGFRPGLFGKPRGSSPSRRRDGGIRECWRRKALVL